ncbi:hypothetical protein HYX06_00880 [Candidatus Woesearchaeota archaeon]|nr:hypothetical protein [Candidatus Woesearchaeota archaeon]
MRSVIIISLKESISLIWKSKSWLLALVIIQIGFFAAVFMVSNAYLPKVLENAQSMSAYISAQNFDEASMTERVLQQKDILGEDPAALTKYFDGVVENFRIYLVYIFVFILVFSSLLWSMTHKITDKLNLKQSMRNFYIILAILLFYLGLIFLFFYLLLNISFSEAVLQGSKIFIKYAPFLVFSVILAYFMFISLALPHKGEIKQVVQKTLAVGIRKAHYILAVYSINLLLAVLFIFLMAYFIDRNFFIVILSIISFIFSFVFARIFIASVVKNLESIE